jgi:hypothetical protein
VGIILSVGILPAIAIGWWEFTHKPNAIPILLGLFFAGISVFWSRWGFRMLHYGFWMNVWPDRLEFASAAPVLNVPFSEIEGFWLGPGDTSNPVYVVLKSGDRYLIPGDEKVYQQLLQLTGTGPASRGLQKRLDRKGWYVLGAIALVFVILWAAGLLQSGGGR